MSHSLHQPFLLLTLILLIGGLLILASAAMSQKSFQAAIYYPLKQLLIGGVGGMMALGITFFIPYRLWKKLALPLLIGSLVLLSLVFIPEMGRSYGGARRWLDLGLFTFQPSELLKLTFVMYLASWLDARRDEVKSVSYGLMPFALMLAIIGAFLIMQPDIGTLGVIVAFSGILYFLGGGKISQMIALSIFGLTALYFLMISAPYRLSRFLVFLNPGFDPQGVGYQISQAFITIGSGGFFGLGFGKGLQKYGYLPEPMEDSIFAIFAEELGFLGVMIWIGVLAAWLFYGMSIAKNAPDVFGKLLAAGICLLIAVQAFIHLAAISGLLPLTGITLPFVSYGGTSLVVTLASVGIVLNISKNV